MDLFHYIHSERDPKYIIAIISQYISLLHDYIQQLSDF